jgi:hypothetical protein
MQALKRFRTSDTLFYQLFIYNAARDAEGAADAVLQAQLWAGPRLVASSPAAAAVIGAEDAPVPHTSRFSLEGLAAGSYELRVTVSDRRSGQNQLRRASFLVE